MHGAKIGKELRKRCRGAFHTHAIMRLGAQIPYKEEMGTILYDK